MQLAASWASIWPPLTLAILAQIAKDLGFQTQLFDSNVQEIEFDQVHTMMGGVDVLVLNTSFPSIHSDLEIAQQVKAKHKEIIIISFGVFFTLIKDKSIPLDGRIDYAILGEPEETFKEWLICLKNKEDMRSVSGLMYLDSTGTPIVNPSRPLIDHLDSIPFPDRSLLHNDRYVLPDNGEPFTLINTSRGCPFPCSFCIVNAYYGPKVRRHSLDYIFNEISDCMTRYGITNFLLWEEAFTLNKNVVTEFCDGLVARKLNIRWAVTTRADTLDVPLLKRMKETGCFLIGMGIESSSQDILDRANKKEKLDDIIRGIRCCQEVGLPVMGHFIFGLPGETKETAKATIRFMKKIGITYMQAYCAVPYPMTAFGDMAKEKKWVTETDWARYDFGGESIVNMPTISARDVTHFRRSAFRQFYFRPSKIIQEIKKLKTLRDFIQALSFMRWLR